MSTHKHFQSTHSLLPTVDQTQYGEFTKSQFLSTSMLRHGNPSISFTKAERFRTTQSVSSTDFYNPQRKLGRTTNFGYGQKKIFNDFVINNAVSFPSPNKYHTGIDLKSPSRGKSFGLSFKSQAKKYAEHQPDYIDPSIAKNIPGPGTYEIQQIPGQGKVSKSMSERREMYKIDPNPASNFYRPKYNTQKNSRFNRITFGVGNKYDFTKTVSVFTPGPGTYKAMSPFDKFEKPGFLKGRKIKQKKSKSQGNNNLFSYNPQYGDQDQSESSQQRGYNNMNSYNEFKKREKERQQQQQLQFEQPELKEEENESLGKTPVHNSSGNQDENNIEPQQQQQQEEEQQAQEQ